MDKIGQISTYTVSLFGHSFDVNPINFIMTWIVMGILVLIAAISTKRLNVIPQKLQNFAEIVYEFIEDIVISTLGKQDGKKFVPFIFTIFVFTLAANWIGIVPNLAVLLGSFIAIIHNIFGAESVSLAFNGITNIQLTQSGGLWYSFLFNVPDIQEPTRSVNTDLAMALMVFFVVHAYGIKKNGILGYLKGYWGDVIPCHGKWLLLAPINIMIPLNIISEISAVVSHSFRLFGNIFGGFMIITIVSSLTKFIAIPVGLLAFFGLFAGLVQAFVFTMLAVTYIGQKA